MPRTRPIAVEQLEDLAEAIFAGGQVQVFDVYSELNDEINYYNDATATFIKVTADLAATRKFSFLGICYDDFEADIQIERYELSAASYPKGTYRSRCEGWGMINLQCRMSDDGFVEAVFNANSYARASALAATTPSLGSPDPWNWEHVQRQSRRLTRVLTKLERDR